MKFLIKTRQLAVSMVLCLFCFNASADEVAAVLYEDEGYGGASFEIRGDTANLGDFAEKMSSFELTPGYTIRFFLEDNFQGGYYSVNQKTLNSSSNVRELLQNVADKVRSVKVLGYGGYSPVVADIYSGANFSGTKYEFKGDIASLEEYGVKVGSFDIQPGYQVRFFTEENFQGGYYSKGSDAVENAEPSWGATVKSAKIIVRNGVEVVDPTPSGGSSGSSASSDSDGSSGSSGNLAATLDGGAQGVAAILYENEGFGGNYFEIRGDAASLGSFANKASSLKLAPGYSIKLFTNENFSGDSSLINATTLSSSSSMRNVFANIGDKVKSVKVLAYGTNTPVIAEIYSGTNYTGTKYEFKGDIAAVKDHVTSIGSFKINSGYQVRFFVEENFQGGYYSKASDTLEGANPSWGSSVKSVKVIERNGEEIRDSVEMTAQGSPIVDSYFDLSPPKVQPNIAAGVLYTGRNYQGSVYPIWNDYSRLSTGILANVGSFKINPGYEFRFFNTSGYMGTNWTYSTDQPYASMGSNFVSLKISSKPPKVTGTQNDVLRQGEGSEVVAQLFEGLHYTGSRIDMTDTLPELHPRLYRRMKSFKIKPGYEIQFFSWSNFTGSSHTRNSASNDGATFGQGGEKDVASALIVKSPIKNLTAGTGSRVFATLYDEPNQGGTKLEMRGDIPRFPLEFDRRMSSWSIPNGYGIRLFDGLNYTGNQWNRLGSQPYDRNNFGPNNKIRSAKLTLLFGGGRADAYTIAQLWDEPNFQGLKFDVKGHVPEIPPEFDAKMSSFRIDWHYTVTFYEGVNYTGKSYSRRAEASDEAHFRSADNKIRSIRITVWP